MTEPVTRIDRRFSDPGTVATPWDETRRVLQTAELSRITTVRSHFEMLGRTGGGPKCQVQESPRLPVVDPAPPIKVPG